jgi:DNA ligase (NAD+)
MGRRSAENLLKGIEDSKSRGLARLLCALSIRHVGQRVANVLADHFGTIEALQAATQENLSSVHEIGDVIAKSVYDFLASDYGRETLADLKQLGLNMETPRKARPADGGVLAGKTLVVTGTLPTYSRDEINDLIQKHGGRAASSVSKKTDFVVAGEDAGTKLEKAQKLGVRVLSEAEFNELIQAAMT